MRRTTLLGAMLVLVLVGCHAPVEIIPDPVEVSGKVVYTDGKPVKNVTLELQPTGVGLPTTMKVGPDGSAKGKLVPGQYVYFFSAPKGATALASIPTKYHAANKEHQSTFSSSGEFEIRIDSQ